jgi:pimeloyl-ACP methyl ester carboxylesterase
MSHFTNDGLSLYYEVHGTGSPVLMLHGAAVTFAGNFGICGWIERLTERGLQVVGLDWRGHGASDAPPGPAGAGIDAMASDAIALLDHLTLERVAVVGYSIGSAVALHLLHTHPDRFSGAALVATGDGLIGVPPHTFPALQETDSGLLDRTEYPHDLPAHRAIYWTFATQVAGNREAVAVALSGDMTPCSPEEAASIGAPVLVVSGDQDLVLGTGARLAQSIPHARYMEVGGADHFVLAVDETVQKAVADFLAG